MAVKVNKTLCTGCGKCAEVCSTKAITINSLMNKAVVYESLCVECGLCIDECRKGALSLK